MPHDNDPPASARQVKILDLGLIDYREAHALQQRLTAERAAGLIADTLLLLEHPHVFTQGRRRGEGNILAAGDVPIVDVERGGDVTYHGPGQLVAYPIFALQPGERDAPGFLRRLEGWIMAALADLGLPDNERRAGYSGVWARGQKLASVGVAITSTWVTWHGAALNVSTDLAYFRRIHPCGLPADVMTSVSALLGRTVTVAEARDALIGHVAEHLGRSIE